MFKTLWSFAKAIAPTVSKVLMALAVRATWISVFEETTAGDFPDYVVKETTATLLSRKMVSTAFAGLAVTLMQLGASIPFLDRDVLNYYLDEIWRLASHANRTPYGMHLVTPGEV